MLKCCTKSGMGLQLLAYTLVINKAINKYGKHINKNLNRFDTYSAKIGIDNWFSACK